MGWLVLGGMFWLMMAAVPSVQAGQATVYTGDVVITEFSAATSDRLVYWPDNGTPSIGAGVPWTDLSYNDVSWSEGPGSFGSGSLGESTVVDIFGKALSVYIRKVFNVTAATASLTEAIQLSIDYEEGYVAYLNGVEVARRGLEDVGGFSYHDQLSNNDLRVPGVPEVVYIGRAVDLLREGANVLAVHVHKYRIYDRNWTISPDLSVMSSPVQQLVRHGDIWRYWKGTTEPLGGLRAPVDPTPAYPDPTLVLHGQTWRYFLGTREPSGALNTQWAQRDFNDSTWAQGPGGFGYGDNDDATVLSMSGVAMSVYIRREFTPTTEQISYSDSLELTVNYDDGFLAYINGVEVARANLGTVGVPVAYNTAASAEREASAAVSFKITGISAYLIPDAVNVLAIQAHNRTLTSSDLSIIADLRFYYNDLDADMTVDLTDDVDWIELHNRGSGPVSLSGWSLTDDPEEPAKWIFPSVFMPPGGYLVVQASGLNLRPTDGTPLHTNFELASDGEFLALYDNQTPRRARCVFSPAYPEQSYFHSYGVVSGGPNGYFVLQRPASPGTVNQPTETAERILDSPAASLPQGFYNGAIGVSLTTTEPGAAIRYTLDGTEPTAANGTLYTTPISILESKSLRAAVFKSNCLRSPILTRTYLIAQPSALKTLPALVISGDEQRSLFEPHGIMAISGGYANLWPPTTIDHYNNGIPSGRAYERPVAAGLIFPADNTGFQVDAGLRTAGRAGRSTRLRSPNWNTQTYRYSLRLYFRSSYGSDRLEYPLFPDSPVDSYKQISLNSGFWDDNTNPALKDELMRRTVLACGQPASRGFHVNLYINGVFKSYLTMLERPVETFFQDYYNSSNLWEIFKLSNDYGDKTTFNWLYAYAVDATKNAALYADYLEMAKRLDMTNFADYLIVNIYGGNCDWPGNNWIMAREHVDGALFRFLPWDSGCSFGFSGAATMNVFDKIDLPNQSGPAARFYYFLKNSPEFRLLFADRIQKHFFNDGALTDANLMARYLELKAVMQAPVTYMQGSYNNNVETDWIPKRRPVVLSQFTTQNLWPALAAPLLNQHGGPVPDNFMVSLSNPAGTGLIYFTIDGTDPRQPGTGVAQGLTYTAPFPVVQSIALKVRVLSNGQWSPLTEAVFITENKARLVISEIMYHPQDWQDLDDTVLEFIELANVGSEQILLNGYRFCNGITYSFPAGAALAPGARLVLVSNTTAFLRKYPTVTPYGQYTGQLSNSGEHVALCDSAGQTVLDVDYGDTVPWPATADGLGFSLVPVDPLYTIDDPAAWRASSQVGGSPGDADPASTIPRLLINEVLTHTDLPSVDTVEIYNPTGQSVDLTGWSLTDDSSEPSKYIFPPGTMIGAGQYRIVDESDFNANPGLPTCFALDSAGDGVFLFSGTTSGTLTGYCHGARFGAAANGVSFGRHLTSLGEEHFPAQKSLTLLVANSGPAVGPVVISEIHYHPDGAIPEFLELKNITQTAVPLHLPDDSSVAWTVGGLSYTFPAGTVLQPGETILLTQLNPADFRAAFSLPATTRVFGPYAGTLDNNGETISLRRPDNPDVNAYGQPFTPYIDVDVVDFSNNPPWPLNADGLGSSLERNNLFAYGDDPANWRASSNAGGTPGLVTAATFAQWQGHAFDDSDMVFPEIAGPTADPDGDGLTNLIEFVFDLPPNHPGSLPVNLFQAAPQWVNGHQYLHATCLHRALSSDVGLVFEVSVDLTNWQSSDVVIQPTESVDGWQQTTARDLAPCNSFSNPRFIRLRVTLTEP